MVSVYIHASVYPVRAKHRPPPAGAVMLRHASQGSQTAPDSGPLSGIYNPLKGI